MRPLDLSPKEQAAVRAALTFLRVRCGGIVPLARVLRMAKTTVRRTIGGAGVSASMAFRVAKLASVGVDDVLTGKYPPPGVCAHCGHDAALDAAAQ